MTRPRFSLAQSMAIVLLVGVGLAVLRSHSVFSASVVFTLTVTVLSTAVLVAISRRGRARLTWSGFALFGWVYLGTTFGPWADGNGVKAPPYVTKWLFDYAQTRLSWGPWMDPGPSGEELFAPMPPPTVVAGSTVAPAPPIPGIPPPVPILAFPDILQFRRIGHCLAAILFGVAGAVLGRFLAPKKDDRPNP